jgi:hypothetical protein
MTLLQERCIISKYYQEHVPVDLEPLAKSRLLQYVSKRLTKREDLFEIEHWHSETVYELKLHVFSEAELIDFRNSVIAEFMDYTGVFRAMHPQQQENNS